MNETNRGSHISVAVVAPNAERRDALRDILSHSKWELFFLANASEATFLIRTRKIAVVLVDQDVTEPQVRKIREAIAVAENRSRLLRLRPVCAGRANCTGLCSGGLAIFGSELDAHEVMTRVSELGRDWYEESWRTPVVEASLGAGL